MVLRWITLLENRPISSISISFFSVVALTGRSDPLLLFILPVSLHFWRKASTEENTQRFVRCFLGESHFSLWSYPYKYIALKLIWYLIWLSCVGFDLRSKQEQYFMRRRDYFMSCKNELLNVKYGQISIKSNSTFFTFWYMCSWYGGIFLPKLKLTDAKLLKLQSSEF